MKVEFLTKYFPEVFVLLRNDLFQEFAKAYGMNPDKAMSLLNNYEQQKDEAMAQQEQQMPMGGIPMPQNKPMPQ